MHGPGLWGIIIVAVVVVVLFGRGKISGVMGEFASGIKAFQKGMRDDDKPPPMTRPPRFRLRRSLRRPRKPRTSELRLCRLTRID